MIWWFLPKIDKGHCQCNWKKTWVNWVNQLFHAVDKGNMFLWSPSQPPRCFGEADGCRSNTTLCTLLGHLVDGTQSGAASHYQQWPGNSEATEGWKSVTKKILVVRCCKDTLLTIDAQGRLLVWLGGINCKVRMECPKYGGPCVNLQLGILSVLCCRGSPRIVFAALFVRPVALPHRLVRYPWGRCVVLADTAPTYIILHSYILYFYISHAWNLQWGISCFKKGLFALIHVWASTLW